MKITAGLGSLDDLPLYAEAGADEVFAGYIPGWWIRKYGTYSPLNRREVLYYNVQIGSESEMEILHDLSAAYGIPVSLTLNSLYYLPEQYPDLLRYVQECMELGFTSFIVADPALLLSLSKQDFFSKLSISVSGEFGEMNRETAELLKKLGVRRVIFHRKMTVEEMKVCAQAGIAELEAFAMNENCRYHGGWCSTLHCDELAHSCHLPYRLRTSDGSLQSVKEQRESLEEYRIGESGCALCALYDLRESGITHLKVVGRGNFAEAMAADIRALHRALCILESSKCKEEYIRCMKAELFPQGCSRSCYYR